ncbi:hypothetical protein LJ753_07350 [Arthrobacter sp. zg-Y20]|uniref:hypothetical protein n=1 Tax=unclassified Arthrobacter TaxID=235627 RepID=UPI001D15C902|nr:MULTISPECIES: hypothetical protein [unclassified Arthrobacter]MCC3275685.1 hypothetical protein [Arthrobacter sp. zg-Y20]MDK1315842.1 hypothetical protein [Arthrobacter sp. zg.Y20]WIB06372.1 hypothetical protein QNO06_01075 [Arthrobacter sp. zg-Y20]
MSIEISPEDLSGAGSAAPGEFYGHGIGHSLVWARGLAEPADAEYMHCGEPMRPRDGRQLSIFEPVSTESMPANAPAEVQLETTVLRCRCGFQLEIPA